MPPVPVSPAFASPDARAADALLRQFGGRLFAYFRAMLGSESEAKRALSATLATAMPEAGRARDLDEYGPRLFMLAHAECGRYQCAEAVGAGQHWTVVTGSGNPVLPEIARRAVSRLALDVREAYILSAPYNNLTLPQMAEVLGVGLDTAADLRAQAGLDFVRAVAQCATEAGFIQFGGAELRIRAEESLEKDASEPPSMAPAQAAPAPVPARVPPAPPADQRQPPPRTPLPPPSSLPDALPSSVALPPPSEIPPASALPPARMRPAPVPPAPSPLDATTVQPVLADFGGADFGGPAPGNVTPGNTVSGNTVSGSAVPGHVTLGNFTRLDQAAPAAFGGGPDYDGATRYDDVRGYGDAQGYGGAQGYGDVRGYDDFPDYGRGPGDYGSGDYGPSARLSGPLRALTGPMMLGDYTPRGRRRRRVLAWTGGGIAVVAVAVIGWQVLGNSGSGSTITLTHGGAPTSSVPSGPAAGGLGTASPSPSQSPTASPSLTPTSSATVPSGTAPQTGSQTSGGGAQAPAAPAPAAPTQAAPAPASHAAPSAPASSQPAPAPTTPSAAPSSSSPAPAPTASSSTATP